MRNPWLVFRKIDSLPFSVEYSQVQVVLFNDHTNCSFFLVTFKKRKKKEETPTLTLPVIAGGKTPECFQASVIKAIRTALH